MGSSECFKCGAFVENTLVGDEYHLICDEC